VMVTGPFMPAEQQAVLQARATTTCRVMSQADNFQLMAAADAVVSMGGYNSVCEALAVARPLVIVPQATDQIQRQIRSGALGSRATRRPRGPAGPVAATGGSAGAARPDPARRVRAGRRRLHVAERSLGSVRAAGAGALARRRGARVRAQSVFGRLRRTGVDARGAAGGAPPAASASTVFADPPYPAGAGARLRLGRGP